MKKFLVVAMAAIFSVSMYGCKKQPVVDESQEAVSMETMSTMGTPLPEAVMAPQASSAANPAKLEPLPPSGPYKPSVKEIQAALQAAGFYSGSIDGKMGPMTKKAIEEFQKANSLTADGKVGTRTWALLGSHLNPAPQEPVALKKR
jgi:peptidoglycan hydrolase-like protein with peptidoglycan-binding domain